MFRIQRRFVLAAVLLGLLHTTGPQPASAQGIFGAGGFGGGQFGAGGFGGGGFGGGQAGVGGLGGGQGGQGGQAGQAGQAGQVGGIMIDAKGVVVPVFNKEKSPKLSKLRMEAAAGKFLAADLNKFSPLRKVSLVRLEQECLEYERQQEQVGLDIHFLAGLQRIDYIFVYPDSGDLVIAGPAEGFAPDAAGRVVGLTTGRPPLRIDDLVIALQALERGGTLGCSIDPDQKRLAALGRYVAQNSGVTTPAIARARYRRMAEILGMQDVRVWGVPAESHFAQTLVEADLRMKRISIGHQVPRVRGFKSHLALLRPGGNSMQRWWFTPLYEAFGQTEDGDAYQLAGRRAQLMAQEEFVGEAGQVSDAPFTRVSTRQFARLFTEKFPELCEEVPVFAELQNLIDLAIVAALLKKEQLPQQVGWERELFLDPGRTRMIKGRVPKQVPSTFNLKKARRGLILGVVGGGVTINPIEVVREVEVKQEESARLSRFRTSALPRQVHEKHLWWWD